MPSGSDSRRPAGVFALAAEGAVWALLFFCPLALASSPPWTLWPLSILSTGAAAATCISAIRQGRTLRLPPFTAVLALGALFCFLQLVPLPQSLLNWLSPPAAELRDFALVPLGLTVARPITLDSPGTWRELVKSISYFSIFFAAVQISRSRSGARRSLLAALALSGVAVALIGYGHALADARTLFGLYSYAVQPPLLTTFGNPNHLSAFLSLTSTVALGLALTANDRHRAAFWGLAYLVMGAAVFLSLSRGGICFFIGAQLMLAFLLFRRRRLGSSRARRTPFWAGRESLVIVGVLAVLSVSAFVAAERIIAEMQTADSLQKLRDSKIQLWPILAEAARHFSRSGMGRGAFEAAFSRYQTAWFEATFTSAENLVLQLWAEFGLLCAAILILLAVRAFLRLLQREETSTLELALLAGIAGLALHDLFDFSLELPGCAVAACVALGAVSRSDSEALKPSLTAVRRFRWPPFTAPVLPPRFALPAMAALALLSLLGAWKGQRTLMRDERELADQLANRDASVDGRTAALERIDRHPADYLLYDMMGAFYSRGQPAHPREALAFANRALFLRPLDVEAHRVAARSLLKLGRRSQAALEYRLAYQAGQDQGATLDESVGFARGLDELTQLVPSAPTPITEVAYRLWQAGRKKEARDLVRQGLALLADHRDAPELWLLEARYRADRREWESALQAAAQAEKGWPGSGRVLATQSAILWDMGRRDEAIALLESTFARHPNDLELSFALANRLISANSPKRARDVLSRASPLVGSPSLRSRWLTVEGASFESEAQLARALQSYQSAARLTPTQPESHYAVAGILEALKRPAEAMSEVREGMKYDDPPGVQRATMRLAQLEEARRKLEELKEQTLLSH